jgi:hypothetical protein
MPVRMRKTAKMVENPREIFDEGGAYADHDCTQDNHAENTPEKHPVLVDAGNSEIREDQSDDENVVHRQCLFDCETSQILDAGLGAQIPPDPNPEKDTKRDVNC